MPIEPEQEAPAPSNPGGDKWWKFKGDEGDKQFDGNWGPAGPNSGAGAFPVTPEEPSVSTREMAINSVIKDEKYGMETLVAESLKEYREAMDKVIKFKGAIAAKEEYKEMIKGGLIITSELNPEDKKAFDVLTQKAEIKEERLRLAYEDKLSDLNPGDTGNPDNIYAAILKLRAEHDTTNLGIVIVKEAPAIVIDPFATPATPAPNGVQPKGATPATPGEEQIPGLEELKKVLPPGFLDQLLDGLRKQQEHQKEQEERKNAPIFADANSEMDKALGQYREQTAQNAPTGSLPMVAKVNDGKDAGVAV